MVRFKYVNKETGAVTMLENQKEALDFVAKSKDVTEASTATVPSQEPKPKLKLILRFELVPRPKLSLDFRSPRTDDDAQDEDRNTVKAVELANTTKRKRAAPGQERPVINLDIAADNTPAKKRKRLENGKACASCRRKHVACPQEHRQAEQEDQEISLMVEE